MTTATSKALQAYLAQNDFSTITDTTSLIAILLLVCIVIEREIVRLSSPENARRNVTSFAIVTFPTFFLFIAVVALRFVRLT